MTLFGKILVVLNLALAVLFFGHAVATYNARLNFQERLAKEKKDSEENRKKADLAANNEDAARKSLADATNKLTQATKDLERAKKDADTTARNLSDQLDNSKKEAESTGQRIIQISEELNRRQKEVDQLRQQRQELIEAKSKLVDDLTNARDTVAGLKNDIEIRNGRIRETKDYENALKKFIAARGLVLPDVADIAAMPENIGPPPNVEGVVREVDDTGKFIKVSLGSNDGLKVGHVLKVWRTSPEAKYLGEIRVATLDVKTAVCKPVGSLAGPVLRADIVGPNTLTR